MNQVCLCVPLLCREKYNKPSLHNLGIIGWQTRTPLFPFLSLYIWYQVGGLMFSGVLFPVERMYPAIMLLRRNRYCMLGLEA